jgi:long-chain acyl-CoA synthetase
LIDNPKQPFIKQNRKDLQGKHQFFEVFGIFVVKTESIRNFAGYIIIEICRHFSLARRSTPMTLIPTHFLPITDFVFRNAQWYPEKTAIIFEDRRITWREFNQRSNRIANLLRRKNLSKEDRVAILSQNCLEYPEIMIGALKAGATVVPISTMLQKETVLLELQDARPKALFAGLPFLAQADAYDSTCCRFVLEGQADGWISYEEIQKTEPDWEPENEILADDLYNIIYSSGTTGNPKGIIHTHQARLRFAMTYGLEFRIHNDAVSLISTPIYSNGTQLIYLPTILLGGTLVIMRAFDPVSFLTLVRQTRCTHAFLVPTQFIRVMAHPQFAASDTSSMEVLLSAAAPLRKETKKEILKRFPKSKLVELYGLTEGISTILRPSEQMSKPDSVGKPRLGGDIKILDETGRELPRGEIGEIAGFNFSMMAEYYRNPEGTAEALWFDQKGRPYIKTGDIGKLDSDGYLYILDRKKDMIISGGINIFSGDLESVLLTHPEIAEAAVIGVPHTEWGESPLALIVKKKPDSTLSEEALRNWANNRLAQYQQLVGVEFRSSLPKNDLGKVLKSELRKPYWNATGLFP